LVLLKRISIAKVYASGLVSFVQWHFGMTNRPSRVRIAFMSGIGAVEFVFLLLLFFIVAFGVLARKLGIPYPIIMVVGGLVLSFIPAVPQIALNPDLIFLVVLPPLLYSSAWTTSWRDFRYNIITISLLAFGLVAFTVIGV